MTAPTITTEDYMFDLDLQVVPVDEKMDVKRTPNASTDCIMTTHISWTCTARCPTRGYTCGRPCKY